MLSGNEDAAKAHEQTRMDGSSLGKVRVKTTPIYFSLSVDGMGPAPKIGFFSAKSAENDEVIVRGLDAWLSEYGWCNGARTLEDRLGNGLELVFLTRLVINCGLI